MLPEEEGRTASDDGKQLVGRRLFGRRREVRGLCASMERDAATVAFGSGWPWRPKDK